jgi:hypothetical protein
MVKTIIMPLPVDFAKTDPEFSMFLKDTFNTLGSLGYRMPDMVKVVKGGVHRDSFVKGFYKVVIKAIYHA